MGTGDLNAPLISIIVSVYNVERYLRKCVDSIINQTYGNLEIILVDDGSPDNCGVICEEYAKNDKRIVVIHKENGGLSSARNTGLDTAKGDFLFFVDSDDWIGEDCIESLYCTLIKDNTDCAVTNYLTVYEDGTCKEIYAINKTPHIFTCEEALKTMLYQRHMGVGACGKLYKKELYEGIRFPEGFLYEDLAVFYKLVCRCDRISLLGEEKYYYLVRADGIIRSPFSARKLDIISVSEEMAEYMRVYKPSCYRAALCRLISAQLHVYFQIQKDNKEEYSSAIRIIENNVKKYRKNVIFDREARTKARCACLLSYGGFRFLRLFFLVMSKKKDML